MSETWNALGRDPTELAAALAALEGTELEEQVFIAARDVFGGQPEPLLDIAHMEEETGDGRFHVYVTLPSGTTLDELDLPWPPGSIVVDDSGDNATIELGAGSPDAVAQALWEVAATLASGGGDLVWSATFAHES